tara:strand:- start:390 stop:1703 length:1314 start_codon:yes stop_codon:yes gene_type:complete
MRDEKLIFFLKLIEKKYILFFLYLFGLFISIYVWSYFISAEHNHITDDLGNLEIYNLNNMNGVYIKSILEEGIPKINFLGMDFYYSMRPILPYFLIFIFENISNNFFLILLIKNILMAVFIFFVIKNYKKNYNNLFLLICLILIFYNPHNVHTMYDIGSEEGFLNYLIIILFFSILGDYKYKSLLVGTTLSLIFFTKESMFILTFVVPLIYLFLEKKNNKYLPLIMVVISNLAWGSYHYKTQNYFPIGPTGSAKNAVNLAIVYHKDFNLTYPRVSPDIYHYKTANLIKKKKITNEKQLMDILIDQSLTYLKENPYDVVKGVFKKLYVVTLSPFKDTRQRIEDINSIRYSNFPNKIIFNLSLILMLINIINKNRIFSEKKIDFYYLIILMTYFIPYMIGFVYPRHCTAMYTLAHLYLFLNITEINKFNINELLKKKYK